MRAVEAAGPGTDGRRPALAIVGLPVPGPPPEPGSGPLALGVDAGGPEVQAVLADVGGATLATGRAGAANPVALPLGVVADHLTAAVGAAVAAALGDADPGQVATAVLGVPGIGRFARADGARALRRVWRRCRLRCPVRVVADPVVAFAAGTQARRGAVLVCGTGTIAAVIDNHEIVTRIDGHGWLLGDDGSGFWLGRQAVRAVLAELDGRGEPTMLRYPVLATLTGSDRRQEEPGRQLELLRDAVYDAPPIALAGLAGLVPAAAEAGDRAAQRIVDRCVALLASTADALLADGPGASADVVVLAGRVLTAPGPIGRDVRRRITERHGRATAVADSGAGGAAWLAARQLKADLDPAVHQRLTTAGHGREAY